MTNDLDEFDLSKYDTSDATEEINISHILVIFKIEIRVIQDSSTETTILISIFFSFTFFFNVDREEEEN